MSEEEAEKKWEEEEGREGGESLSGKEQKEKSIEDASIYGGHFTIRLSIAFLPIGNRGKE